MKILDNKVWKTTQPDKSQYAQIPETNVSGTDKTKVIKKHEWIVTDCALELELEENYTNKLR